MKSPLKLNLIIEVFNKKALPKMLMSGGASRDLAAHVASVLRQATERKLAQAGDMPELEANAVGELQGFVGGLFWLLNQEK